MGATGIVIVVLGAFCAGVFAVVWVNYRREMRGRRGDKRR